MTTSIAATSWAPRNAALAIHSRFAGPPGMANGGYVAGLMAGSGPARVVLRRPVPLDHPLTLEVGAHSARLRDGDTELTQASATKMPRPIGWTADAEILEELPDPAGAELHPFPRCFVCGPEHDTGLNLRMKRVDRGIGALFLPPADDPTGEVPLPYIVGALDCISGWASYAPGEAGVLGTIEFAVMSIPEPGEMLIAVAEAVSQEGRKRLARSTVRAMSGALIGVAAATWIDIPHPG